MSANLLHRWHESQKREDDQIDPWIRKRHGVPAGYVFVDDQPWYWLWCGSVREVEHQYREAHCDDSRLVPIPGKRNCYTRA